MPNIAVLNSSTTFSDPQIRNMLASFERQWNHDLAPVWNVEKASFTFVAAGQAAAPGTWWLVFLDDSDQANALAYHDLTIEGLPLSKVFVRTILSGNGSVSVGATHELCEMAVDPWINSAYQDSQGVFWAGEICDPVEDDQYGYLIDGTLVSDFVTPNWFAHKYAKGAIDQQGHALAAFEILTGGYAQKYDSQAGWQQVTGSKAARSAMAKAQPGSRRERRTRQSDTWTRSIPADRLALTPPQ